MSDDSVSTVGRDATWISSEEALEITGNNFTFGKSDKFALYNCSSKVQKKLMETLPEETLVIDGDRMYFDECSEFTKEQSTYLVSRYSLEYHPPLIGTIEEKSKQKPSVLLLNLMRNI